MLLVLALAGLARPSYVLPAEQLGLRDPARLLEAPSPDLMGPSLFICSTSFWPAKTDTDLSRGERIIRYSLLFEDLRPKTSIYICNWATF